MIRENPNFDNESIDPNFVPFPEYKKYGGAMSIGEYDRVQLVNPTEDLIRAATDSLIETQGRGAPDLQFLSVYAKLLSVFPDRGHGWILLEVYLCLGRI